MPRWERIVAGILFVSVAAILWGTVGVANRLMESGALVDPTLAGFSRTTLGAVSLLLAAEALRLPWGSGRLPWRLLLAFGAAGAVFQICLFAAYVQVGVTVTVAVTVCAPVVLVVAAEAAWRRRWPEIGAAIAIGIGSVGVVMAMGGDGPPTAATQSANWLGIALLVTASVAYAVVAAIARVIARDLHPLRATGLGLGFTAAVLGLVVLLREQTSVAVLGSLPAHDLAILGYTGVAATGGAYLAFVVGLHLSRSAASGLAATLIEPGVAAVLAVVLLSEQLAPPETLGCALMLGAMVVLFLSERRAVSRPAVAATDASASPAT
jgi:DME family drug/metabolite transporter